jgi:proteasome accessory factor B
VSALKTERLLNLVICLLSTRQFLAKEQIRAAVPQYAECRTTEAFDRQFERDKEELREMGVPLQTGSHSAWFEDETGYRIDRAAYALPAVSFEPDELAVLGLASRVWQQASLASAASRALLKLKASGVEPDESSLLGIEPRVRASEPAFEPLYAATIARRPVRFPYRAAGGAGSGQLTDRHVEPWGIVSWHGRWYLVAHDRDREATRVFRLSRVAGEVQALGEPGEVVVPEGVDFRAEVARLAADPPQAEARVRVRPARAAGLRRRAVAAAGDDAGWDVLTVPYGDTEVLAEELAGLGGDAVVDAPAEVRAAVVRRLRATLHATLGAAS